MKHISTIACDMGTFSHGVDLSERSVHGSASSDP